MILWQWINQSYNAVFNYCNRNTSTESNNADILKAYCSATIVSVGVALAGNKLVAKCGGGGLLGKVGSFPFTNLSAFPGSLWRVRALRTCT